jgi:hypothetical protein
MVKRKTAVFSTAVVAAAVIGTLGLGAQTTLPRVQNGNLTRLGTFYVPRDIHSGGQANAGFEYGGTAMSHNPARNSLFLVGHDWDQFLGEISIPAFGETAALLQPLVEPTEGRLTSVNPGDPNRELVGGTLPWGSNLIVSVYSYYDANGTQVVSHFVRPMNLATTGQVTGPIRVGPLGAGFYSGYMGLIPTEWQAKLGGPALTGNGGLGIISRTSYGPAAFAFDPSAMNSDGAKALVYYPSDHTTLGPWSGASQYYSGSDTINGIVLPKGTSSILFFGRHGGSFCYGTGTSDQSKAGQQVGDGSTYCYDPDNGSKGVHGYPYSSFVWAYDANDLAAVRTGAKQPWDVVPYAGWSLSGMGANVGGAAYDPATNRIYVSERGGDGDRPKIHVFTVTNATTGPSPTPTGPPPPSNIRVIAP